MKKSNVKKFLFVFLPIVSLLSGLMFSPVSMTTVDAKTKIIMYPIRWTQQAKGIA